MDTQRITEHLGEFRLRELPRLRRLADYYAGKHDILRGAAKSPKPDNRLVNNFCRSITDCTVGYFMGIPVAYTSDDADTLRLVRSISMYNDEPFTDSALARDLSVSGRAAEILWLDGDRMARFTPLDPSTVFPIESDDLDGELEAAVRFYVPRGGDTTVVEVYTPDTVGTYKIGAGTSYSAAGVRPIGETVTGTLEKIGEREHYFGMVPVNFYKNNRDMTGDFEPVMSLVDAYNRLESDSVNDFELFADSYLVISGMGGADREDIERFRRDRVLLVDEGGDARWLTKETNDAYIENLKSRIARDIYRFSNTVDMSDASFTGGSVSGTALRYRMAGFDNRVAATEQYFRRGLMRRWELISSVEAKLGERLDWRSLDIRFTRNTPANTAEAVDMASKLDGIVSKETICGILPFAASPATDEGKEAAV